MNGCLCLKNAGIGKNKIPVVFTIRRRLISHTIQTTSREAVYLTNRPDIFLRLTPSVQKMKFSMWMM